ncbi:hypothetical protein ACQJBY_057644 [Aegilops geniculata]
MATAESLECSEDIVKEFSKRIKGQLWRVETMLLLNAIFAGIIVGIGAFGHRYRHYGFTRYLLLGATTLFLPIISYVLSTLGSTGDLFDIVIKQELVASCWANGMHSYMAIASACLVLISAINTSPIVATDDREDRSVHPPFELLVQGIWIVYLAIPSFDLPDRPFMEIRLYLRIIPFALIYAKMALKCYAFLKARRSFALGRNPRLVVGYMQQLLQEEGDDQHGEEDVNVPPPPLVVTGEDKRQVEKQPEPHGYMFRNNMKAHQDGNLVTIDRVWQLDNMFLMPMPQRMKDICLSFALFKLLRCRFARYKLADVITKDTIKFVRSVLLEDGEHERAFRMIADELSFLHDYYDSPLPVLYSGSWFTITLSMVISLLSICYCILYVLDVIKEARIPWDFPQARATISCMYFCTMNKLGLLSEQPIWFGRVHFDLVPGLLLVVFVVVAEARDIAFHICSNWTKVILTCRCVRRASLKLSPVVPKWVGRLLRCRCDKLMRHWNDKMRQSSLLLLHPRQFHQLVLSGCLLRLLDRKKKNVEVPTAVKACIIDALRSTSSGGLSKGTTSLRQSQDGRSLLWACNSRKGTSDTILVWHIATTILEVRHPHHQHDDPPQQTPTPQGGRPSSASISDKTTAATHLSRYCAYLVASCPELLPDDDTWSKDLYNRVKNDADRALTTTSGGIAVSSLSPEAGYLRLIQLLGATQNHELLKDAAKLAAQLGELTGGEEMAWELLAGFWSEMILYLAPSDNLKGHLQAVDWGGELITLLWALLTHIGIIDRPGDTAASAPATGV